MKVPWQLHLIAFIVVLTTLAAEGGYLFYGTQANIPDVLIGRILGTFDTSLALILGYYFTASILHSRSTQRTSDTPIIPTDSPANKGPIS